MGSGRPNTSDSAFAEHIQRARETGLNNKRRFKMCVEAGSEELHWISPKMQKCDLGSTSTGRMTAEAYCITIHSLIIISNTALRSSARRTTRWIGTKAHQRHRRMELLKRAIQSMRVPARATLLPQLSTRCARSPHAQAHGSGEEAEVDS